MVGNLTVKKGAKLFGETEITMLTDPEHLARDAYLSLKNKIKERGYFLGRALACREGNGSYTIKAGIFECRDSRNRVYNLEATFVPESEANKAAFAGLFCD